MSKSKNKRLRLEKKRRRASGAHKGAKFERKICVMLSKWVSGGKRTDLFWRTAMSGGRATVMRRKGKDIRQSGDICAVAPEGHPFMDCYYVETKFYRRVQFEHWILNGGGPIKRWLKKAQDEAAVHERIPMLIIKENGGPVLVIMPDGESQRLEWQPRAIVPEHAVEVYLLDDLVRSPFRI